MTRHTRFSAAFMVMLFASLLVVIGFSTDLSSAAGNPASSSQENTLKPDLLRRFSPLTYGGTDRNLITGPESYPHVSQGDSYVAAHGSTVIVTYNDSREVAQSPSQVCGISYSTDAGNTWTRITPSELQGLGSCSYPTAYYSARPNRWYVNAQVNTTLCGGNAIGQWESPDGINWSRSGCILNGYDTKRLTAWADNNPASPYYGRQYMAVNNFTFGPDIYVTYSIDDGVTWASPQSLGIGNQHVIRLDGSPGSDGTVFIQTLREECCGLDGLLRNYIYRSTNGGATWQELTQNPTTYYGPGRSTDASNLATWYDTPESGKWQYRGWGDLGVGPNGVVHYAYTDRPSATPIPGQGYDPGDIEYIRSTDNGATWSAPLKLNTDATTRGQWQPSLSVDVDGTVFVSWNDERNTPDYYYEHFGRFSSDNGLTWQSDMAVSDVVIPRPFQVDPSFPASYISDQVRADADGGVHYHAWADGRNAINGVQQSDIYFDRFQPPSFTPTPSPTPTENPTSTPTNSPVPTATVTATPTITLTPTPVVAPDFNISVTPPSKTVPRPGNTQYTVTLTSLNNFSGNVSLSVSGMPHKVTGAFSPPIVTLSPGGTATSVLSISADRGGPQGTFTLSITGTSGTTSHTQVVTLTVMRP